MGKDRCELDASFSLNCCHLLILTILLGKTLITKFCFSLLVKIKLVYPSPVGDEAPGPVVGADVEGLALGGGVCVVASLHQTITGEAGVRHLSIDGIVLAWDPGDVDLLIVHTP